MKVRIRLLFPNRGPRFEWNENPQEQVDGVLLVGIYSISAKVIFTRYPNMTTTLCIPEKVLE